MFPYYASDGEFLTLHSIDREWGYIEVDLVPEMIPSYSIPILILSIIAVTSTITFKNKQKF